MTDQTGAAPDSPLREQIAAALYERERPPRDPAWADAYAMDREVFEPMADAVLAVVQPHVDRAVAELAQEQHLYALRSDQLTRVCRERQAAEERLARVRSLADRWENALAPDRAYARSLRAALAAPDDGPSVAEAAEQDRNWDLQKGGE